MRIIAGDYKGRRLEGPLDDRVRPTGDKVKEAIFSIIMNHLDGSICCDLFSGTGNLGLEALSRGCDKCYFMDESSNSIKRHGIISKFVRQMSTQLFCRGIPSKIYTE